MPMSKNLRITLLRTIQYIHRHTSWLNGLKRGLGLEKLAIAAVSPAAGSREAKDIIRTANTTWVFNQFSELSHKGLTTPDVYILAAEAMGDVLSCEPIGRVIKQMCPGCRLHWIVRSTFSEVIEAAPFIDDLICVETLSDGYDLILEKQHAPNAVTVNCHMDGTRCLKTNRLIRNAINPRVNVFSYFNFGTLLNAFSLCAGLPMLNDDAQFHFKSDVCSPLSVRHPYIVLHCRSNSVLKDWDDLKWNQLTADLHKMGHKTVEVGMPRTVNDDSDMHIDFTGKKSLQQVARIIDEAALFIGIDSGFAHVACATRTPSVILLGKYAHYQTYMPYSGEFANSDKFKIIRADSGSYARDIPVEAVIENVRSSLCCNEKRP